MSYSIETLRAEARRLKKAFRQDQAEAAQRLRLYVDTPDPKHADFLHVIAREHGADSWPKLKFQIEAAALDRSEKAEQLKYALYSGHGWRIRQLLQDTPDLVDARLDLQIAMYDLDAVEKALADRPAAATEIIGVRSPILHLAFSRYHKIAPEKCDDMLAIAALLVDHGADVDDGYPAEPGSEHLLSALYGALGHADNLMLAEWLLARGANPNDDESLYHSTELGHADGLKLLARYDVKPDGTNALLRAIDADNAEMVQILLDLGAEPNAGLVEHPSGQPVDSAPALHHAAYRWAGAEVAELLLTAGADPMLEWRGATAYAIVRTHGNVQIAALLEARGMTSDLTAPQQALADAARGQVVDLDPGAEPATRDLLHRLAAEPGHLDHLLALVRSGFDPDATDGQGMTPLHLAAWQGIEEYVAYLLTLSPDLTLLNTYDADALQTAVHGAGNSPRKDKGDYMNCVRLLIEAGAQVRPSIVEMAPDDEMADLLSEHLSA